MTTRRGLFRLAAGTAISGVAGLTAVPKHAQPTEAHLLAEHHRDIARLCDQLQAAYLNWESMNAYPFGRIDPPEGLSGFSVSMMAKSRWSEVAAEYIDVDDEPAAGGVRSFLPERVKARMLAKEEEELL